MNPAFPSLELFSPTCDTYRGCWGMKSFPPLCTEVFILFEDLYFDLVDLACKIVNAVTKITNNFMFCFKSFICNWTFDYNPAVASVLWNCSILLLIRFFFFHFYSCFAGIWQTIRWFWKWFCLLWLQKSVGNSTRFGIRVWRRFCGSSIFVGRMFDKNGCNSQIHGKRQNLTLYRYTLEF